MVQEKPTLLDKLGLALPALDKTIKTFAGFLTQCTSRYLVVFNPDNPIKVFSLLINF
jgi:hypothetical protein